MTDLKLRFCMCIKILVHGKQVCVTEKVLDHYFNGQFVGQCNKWALFSQKTGVWKKYLYVGKYYLRIILSIPGSQGYCLQIKFTS